MKLKGNTNEVLPATSDSVDRNRELRLLTQNRLSNIHLNILKYFIHLLYINAYVRKMFKIITLVML